MVPEEKNLYYFISDVHLGLRVGDFALRERKFAAFLDSLPHNVKAIYLLGDIFDFWYEYKYVIPRGYTRTLGKLGMLRDSGVDIFFFKGNHDVWAYNYFEQELGMKVLEQPYLIDIEGKKFCLGHGDGLGYTSASFCFLRWVFHNKFFQFLFSSLVHPRWAFAFGYSWSKHTRLSKTVGGKRYLFRGNSEPIFKFANNYGKSLSATSDENVDYYIFGHFHTPVQIEIPSGGEMYILGEWINDCDYIVFDGNELQRKVAESAIVS